MLPLDCQVDPSTPMFNDGRLISDEEVVGVGSLTAGKTLTVRRHVGPMDSTTLRLSVEAGPDAGASFPLTRGQHIVGRSPDADITIDDPNLSRRHLMINVGLHAVTIRDLGSTNGTSCGGVRLTADECVLGAEVAVIAGHSQFALSGTGEPPAHTEADGAGYIRVHRPPLQGLRWTPRTFELPEKPAGPPRPKLSWIAAAVPALASVVLALVFRSPQLLAFAALSPVSMFASTLGERRNWRRTEKQLQQQYETRSARIRADIDAALIAEEADLRNDHPGPSVLLHSAQGPGSRLWERRRADPAFLQARVGLGDDVARTSVRTGSAPPARESLRMVPLTVDLMAGPFGIAGPAERARATARFVLAQMLALHSPADLQVIALVDDDNHWRWLRWASQHVIAAARAELDQTVLIENLLRTLDDRELAPHSADGRWSGPWTIVLLDPAARVAHLPRIADLLARGCRVGIGVICLADTVRALPTDCATTLDVDPDADGWGQLSGTELSPRRVGLDAVGLGWSERLTRALAPLKDAGEHGTGTIPGDLRLSELFGVTSFEPALLRQNWRRTGPVVARLGMTANGRFDVDLVKDGPHILIAGTTGSGKSELLRTFVASLACAHGPERLSFVLVDYKGGAAFAECAAFPHVLGLVTDLDAHLTRRALISLDAELRRREAAFARVGVSDLASYQNAPRSEAEPLTRLVLVIDEFATLAEELPNFLNGLLGIAQRGRSLGVHLVLATQRPAGVLSQDIKANMSLRIALRVTDAAESTDVINDPGACRIGRQSPGRAFARRTDGDLIEFQTAGASLPILPADRIQVTPLDSWNRPTRATNPDDIATELQSIQRSIAEAAIDAPVTSRPWLDPLPMTLVAEPSPDSYRLRFGLLDEPQRQRQSPLEHDLLAGGVVALIGGSRSGRTSGLRTMLGIAAAQLTPDQVHVYVVDVAGGLRRSAQLAHCGTYVDDAEPSRIARLIARLADEIGARRSQLSDWGVANSAEALAAGHAFPTVLVLIDGWDTLSAISDEVDGGRMADETLHLMRDAASAGFSFVVTGDRALLSARISGTINRKLLLPLTDAGDYSLAGVSSDAVPAEPRPGRGVEADAGAEFQLCLLTADRTVQAQWGVVANGARQDATGTGPSIRLRPLPTQVRLADQPGLAGSFILGRGGDEGRPIHCDLLGSDRHFLIAGPARSGKSSAALMLATQAVAQGRRVVVAASARSPLASWANDAGQQLISPADMAMGIQADLVFVDDAEQFVDTAAGDDLAKLVSSDELAAVVTARSDDLLVSFRGLGVEMRRHRTGVLLQPSSVDGELLGVRLSRSAGFKAVGQGILVTDSSRATADGFLPLQLAQV